MNTTFSLEEQNQIKKLEIEEEKRQQYRAVFNKIRSALEKRPEPQRAFWELMQNARDYSDNAIVKIELHNDVLSFSHQGISFTKSTLRDLIMQRSSKSASDSKTVGQYGTGFMTTHTLNRKVAISGSCRIDYDNKVLYMPLNQFEIDRSSNEQEDFIKELGDEINKLDELITLHGELTPREWTTFEYNIKDKEELIRVLEDVEYLIPYVMVCNSKIVRCLIIKDKKTTEIVREADEIIESKDGYDKIKTTIRCNDSIIQLITICSKDRNDYVIIPPLPMQYNDPKKIPSCFLYFPLIGTEKWGVNFIFHSTRLYPTELRNSYLLPEDNENIRDKFEKNVSILHEMLDMLFKYYDEHPNEQNIPLDFANVEFDYTNNDRVTAEFYSNLQNKVVTKFRNYKMIPHNETFVSIEPSGKLAVLRKHLYMSLTEGQLQKYLPMLEYYLKLHTREIPSSNLIEWSKIIHTWDPKEEKSYYWDLKDFIVPNMEDDNLKLAIEYLHCIGEEGKRYLEQERIFPSREKKLKKKNELYKGIDIPEKLYTIVKPILGDSWDKLVLVDYENSVNFNEFTRLDLKKDIDDMIRSYYRKQYIDPSNKQLENQKQLTLKNVIRNIIQLCCIYHDSNDLLCTHRSRLMPKICALYRLPYNPLIIKSSIVKDSKEFYKEAFDFLVEYTVFNISKTSIEWLKNDINYYNLLEFYQVFVREKNNITLLNKYAIIPNQLKEFSLLSNLKTNINVPSEMEDIYKDVFDTDLKKIFVDDNFITTELSIIPYDPVDIGKQIEDKLKDQEYSHNVVLKILQLLNTEDRETSKGEQIWRKYFCYIHENRQRLYYKFTKPDDKDAIFRIQLQCSSNQNLLKDIAELTETDNFQIVLYHAKNMIETERLQAEEFAFLHRIGKLIENTIRQYLCDSIIDLKFNVHDNQYGQDIVITKEGEEIYYIECKSKWNFESPARMSSLQIKKAVKNKERYAVCCIDCTRSGCGISANASDTEFEAQRDNILRNTYVLTEIGEKAYNIIDTLMQHETSSPYTTNEISISSDLTCNIPKSIFTSGMLLEDFIKNILIPILQQ